MTVDDLIPAVFANTKAMCDALGVTKGAISQWRQSGIPELRVYQIRAVIKARRTRRKAVPA